MSNKAIYTAAAPSAIGPYSQGISAREYAFISGQLPIDPATGAFPSEDIAAQTRQSLLNLKAIIEANGMTMADVVKTTVLLADINEFGAMNEVYGEFFAEPYPARAVRSGSLAVPEPEVERHSRQLHPANTQHTGMSVSVAVSWMRFTTVTAVCITKSPCTADRAGHCPARCG